MTQRLCFRSLAGPSRRHLVRPMAHCGFDPAEDLGFTPKTFPRAPKVVWVPDSTGTLLAPPAPDSGSASSPASPSSFSGLGFSLAVGRSAQEGGRECAPVPATGRSGARGETGGHRADTHSACQAGAGSASLLAEPTGRGWGTARPGSRPLRKPLPASSLFTPATHVPPPPGGLAAVHWYGDAPASPARLGMFIIIKPHEKLTRRKQRGGAGGL